MAHGLNTKEQQELLFSEAGINWNDYDPEVKRGTAIYRQLEDITTPKGNTTRNKWRAGECPVFQTPDGKKWLDEKLCSAVTPLAGDIQKLLEMMPPKPDQEFRDRMDIICDTRVPLGFKLDMLGSELEKDLAESKARQEAAIKKAEEMKKSGG